MAWLHAPRLQHVQPPATIAAGERARELTRQGNDIIDLGQSSPYHSTAAALFPAEFFAWPPRSYVERLYNITQWTEMPRGGHFAALEQPDLLIDDIRTFARTLR